MLRTFKEGSLFCVATRLRAEWYGVRIPFGATITLFLTCSNRPGPTLPSILWVPGLKQAGRETDCSSTSGAEVQNECSYTSPVTLSWCRQGHCYLWLYPRTQRPFEPRRQTVVAERGLRDGEVEGRLTEAGRQSSSDDSSVWTRSPGASRATLVLELADCCKQPEMRVNIRRPAGSYISF